MTGLLIGAIFGAVFVVVNAHEPLNGVAAVVLRVAACLAAAAVAARWAAEARRRRPGEAGRAMFGRWYLAVVAAEAVLLFGGLRALDAWGLPEQANVAWVALVVGVHFVALAPVWRAWGIAVPGVLLTALGGTGLALVATPAVAWVPFVSGVLSGAVLLAGSVSTAWRARPAPEAPTPGTTANTLAKTPTPTPTERTPATGTATTPAQKTPATTTGTATTPARKTPATGTAADTKVVVTMAARRSR
ncbi:hypothetical protein MF672_024610 [Actinomadura sp. ATCC 31491]|uniref:Uncharacterized protein n=1 Tax=Actinomadura luzonensis TaxID=2805427 RepID=A0ABT0FX73_9ACTN|nr:hypothetical protein [Actinomadura luzonensis]MCK2216949.1 hypothetical protein [Actinomadura luzonensis]